MVLRDTSRPKTVVGATVAAAKVGSVDDIRFVSKTSVSVDEAQKYVEKLLIGYKEVPREVQSLSCTRGSCTLNGPTTGNAEQRSDVFLQTAFKCQPVTDKVTTHGYEVMYGAFLMPIMDKPGAKFLEIGLGCNMGYGPGASVALWRKLFRPDAELWEAEYNATCVDVNTRAGKLHGIHTLVGDQGDREVLKSWVSKSGRNFDVVIDDGSHLQKHILTSFEELWPAVKSGGMYVMEDLQVGRRPAYNPHGSAVVSDIVQSWVQQLVEGKVQAHSPIPQDIGQIFCQREACLFIKM